MFNFSENVQNIFKIRLKKYGTIVQKSLLEKKKNLEIKNSQTRFKFLYLKLGTVQILGAIEQILFDLQFFKVSPLSEKIVSRKRRSNDFLRKQTPPQTHSTWFSDNLIQLPAVRKVFL